MSKHLLVLATISEHLYIGAWLEDVQDRMESAIKPVNTGLFLLRNSTKMLGSPPQPCMWCGQLWENLV